MLHSFDLTNILFLDIETVPEAENFHQLSLEMKELWSQRCKFILRDSEVPDEEVQARMYLDKAAIYAEFGKIVCISVGILVKSKQLGYQLRTKSFYGHDEKALLKEFCELLDQYYNDPKKHGISGHNIKEFDIPYICRRLMITQLGMPVMFDIQGKKPWELSYLIDTMDLWKFGDYKHFTSLRLLAGVLNVPSPKDDIDGSEVGKVYYETGDLERIARYCAKDVVTVVQLMMRFKLMPLLDSSAIKNI